MELNPGVLPFIIAGGMALTVLVLGLALAGDGPSGSQVKRRLKRVSADNSIGDEASISVRRRDVDASASPMGRLLAALVPAPKKMRARLDRTGRSISLSQYFVANLLVAALFLLVFKLAASLPWIIAVPLSTTAGLALPHMVVGMMASRRTSKFIESFPDAIDLMIRGLRSGLPVSESIKSVAAEMSDPVGTEFSHVADALKLGSSIEEAMWSVARRLQIPEFKFLVIAMSIQRETGGNLAETLGNLSTLLRQRKQFKLKIRAMS
ncbi:MAG: type II secretion system F family protein, partial [Cytophagales bacterium]|nr:type II secretion system F family protein [Cytophagales bacterium]